MSRAVLLLCCRMRVKVEAVYRDEKETPAAMSGENLRLRISGAEDTDISPGFVLSSIKNPVPLVTQFEAQLMIVELLEHNPIFTVGYKSILHIHTAVEDCEVSTRCHVPQTMQPMRTRHLAQADLHFFALSGTAVFRCMCCML